MDGAGGGAATPTTRGRGPGAPALAAHHAALRWRQTALRDGVLRARLRRAGSRDERGRVLKGSGQRWFGGGQGDRAGAWAGGIPEIRTRQDGAGQPWAADRPYCLPVR